MTANIITLSRIVLVFGVIAILGTGFWGQLIAFLVTILVIWMDALDGYVARRLRTASDLGALLDITGDRIVENIFWIYFASIDRVSVWVAIIVITRGFLTDTLRSLAFAEGKTAFGEKTMMTSPLTRFLVSSRFSRALYGVCKAVVFCWLVGVIALRGAIAEKGLVIDARVLQGLDLVGDALVYVTVAMCVIRGLPVLWDGRRYLLEKRYPKHVRKEP